MRRRSPGHARSERTTRRPRRARRSGCRSTQSCGQRRQLRLEADDCDRGRRWESSVWSRRSIRHESSTSCSAVRPSPPSCDSCCMDLEVSPHLTIPRSELLWKFTRSSGPGGQHVNTSDSRVQLSWSIAESAVLDEDQRELLLAKLDRRLVTGAITVTVAEQRSQLRNREVALARLRTLLRNALAPPSTIRRTTRPTRGSARRHLAAKKARSVIKQQRQRPTGE